LLSECRNLRARFQHDWRRPRFIATVSSAQLAGLRVAPYSLIQRSLSLPLTRSSATCSAVCPLGTATRYLLPRLVIDEDMRTRTLNSRLSFESHSIAAGCVTNLSTHLCVTGWPRAPTTAATSAPRRLMRAVVRRWRCGQPPADRGLRPRGLRRERASDNIH
jgi:hypothetical protein